MHMYLFAYILQKHMCGCRFEELKYYIYIYSIIKYNNKLICMYICNLNKDSDDVGMCGWEAENMKHKSFGG